MKFLCVECNRLLPVERFRVDGAVLIITCTVCSAESRAVGDASPAASPQVTPVPANVTPLRAAAPVEAVIQSAAKTGERAFEVPEGHCPKCISRKPKDAAACASCGLVFAQADIGAFAPSEWLKGEWLQLLGTWGDEGNHEALRSAAVDKGELAELGRLYRLRLAEQPKDPYAVRGRDEVLRLAVLPSLSMQQAKGEGGEPKWKYIALSVVMVGCLIAIFLLVRQILRLS